MNERSRAYLISITIHSVFVLALLGLSSDLAGHNRPAALDLSLLGGLPAPAPERPLHPRARPGPANRLPPAAAPARPQVQRVNVTAGMAPVPAPPAEAAMEQEPVPAQAPALSRDAVRARYVGENFGRIRDRIQGSLVYPRMARKMGWAGRVVVSFIVGVDGCVKDIKILDSCGFEALDRNAVETIKRGSPYPPPQTETELVMPITYKLE